MAFDKKKALADLRARAKKPIFMVVDANYYIHRALHTYPDIKTAQGISVGAVHGALAMICGDYMDLRPDYVAISFDVPGLNFRHQIEPSYKYNDPLDPGHFPIYLQVLMATRLLRLVGFPVIALQGVESDDVVGACAYQAKHGLFDQKVNTLLMTGDKDLSQFVGPSTFACDTKTTGSLRDPKEVRRHFGCEPSQIADYLALMGDENDGVSGLPGVGPSKARALLAEFGSIQGILKLTKQQIQDSKWAKLLTPSSLAHLRKCYALTRIRVDVNVARYGPFKLRPCHPTYLREALLSLHINRVPALVTSQLEKAALAGASLFEGEVDDADYAFDADEFKDLNGCLWEFLPTDKPFETATFMEE